MYLDLQYKLSTSFLHAEGSDTTHKPGRSQAGSYVRLGSQSRRGAALIHLCLFLLTNHVILYAYFGTTSRPFSSMLDFQFSLRLCHHRSNINVYDLISILLEFPRFMCKRILR